ncbi:MAG: 3-methylcrotonyl-CoA carboxylase [Bacteroidota bacterium]|nr:3-methylcrotonyl-CoA carboxylase [Bacteroidota bacterium]
MSISAIRIMKTIKKILVANRGEIAIRVMRTASEMGITTVAIYSDADSNALFVKKADEAVCIGGTHASESYLVQDKIIAAAKLTGADAIHPGYGFLSENADFSQRCKDEGIIFIGPSAEAITAMGSKIGAKELMKKAGVPVVPGYNEADQSPPRLKKEAEKIGYPVLLKASAGGGGKGMRIVNKSDELEAAVEGASREALKSFGDGSLLMEKYFASAKHIEFQIFGDNHGNYTHFFERECSLQRRYQKVIEESPSPSLNDDLRKKMGDAAVAAAKSINYNNAGTVEFILDKQGNFYFLEVNTRLQVEHPVTEETTGLDLVRLQIEVAQGQPLIVNSSNVKLFGHSIQCRVCAEDPENNFFPATGQILFWTEPELAGMRYDSGVESGSKVDVFYDSLIAKVISKGGTRTEAINKMVTALDKMSILGITTNKDFLKELLQNHAFIDGSFDTKLIEREYSTHKKPLPEIAVNELAIASLLGNWNERRQNESLSHSLNGWRNIFYSGQVYELETGDKKIKLEYRYNQNNKFDIRIGELQLTAEIADTNANSISCILNSQRKKFFIARNGAEVFLQHPVYGTFRFNEVPRFIEPGAALAKGGYAAPMPGEIVRVLVKPGEAVKSGKGLVVMSSMKMETTIEAHSDGEVEEIFVAEKSFVEANTVLLKMKNL